MEKARRWRGPLTVLFRLTLISGALYVATGLLYSWLPARLATASDEPVRQIKASTPPAPSPMVETAPTPDLRPLLEGNIFQNAGVPPQRRSAEGDETLALLGTVIGKEARAVLRIGQHQGLYREGDSVAGARIERIERHRVTVRRRGRLVTLLVEERRTDPAAAGPPREMAAVPEEGGAGTVEVQPRPLPLPRPPAGTVQSQHMPRTAVKTDPVSASARESENGGVSRMKPQVPAGETTQP